MKTVLLSLLFTWSIIYSGHSQFSLGLEAGANFSSIEYQNYEVPLKAEISPNYYLAIAPRYAFNAKFSLISNISYSVLQSQNTPPGNVESSKYKNSYVFLMPQLEYRVYPFVGVALGAYGGFNVNEAEKLPETDWFNTKDIDIIAPTDFGLSAAVRTYYKRFFLKLEYDYGLQNILNVTLTDVNGVPLDINNYNRNFQVGLGYLFSFDKS